MRPALSTEAALPAISHQRFADLLDRTVARLSTVAVERRDEEVRQAGSALYHIATAIFMAWEASQQPDNSRRLALAHLLLQHKLLPRDPLNPEPAIDAQLLSRLANESPLSHAEAMQLLPV